MNNRRFENKIVLVMGSNSGMGFFTSNDSPAKERESSSPGATSKRYAKPPRKLA